MTNRYLLIASLLLTIAMIGAAIWTMLSPGAPTHLPVHWNMRGEADGYAPAWVALLMAPGLTVLISALILALPTFEPRAKNLASSSSLYFAIWAGLLIVFAAVDVMVLGVAWHWPTDNPRILMGAMGAMLVLLGNQLGKSRSMFTVGIRTPWTLSNEDVWIGTHRLGGKLFVLCGILWLIGALSGVELGLVFPALFVVLMLAAGVPVVYSWWLWRRLGGENGPIEPR